MIQCTSKKFRFESGFTLIELMIVIGIIGILAMFALPALLASRRAANQKAGMSALRSVMMAEHTFREMDGDRNQVTNYWTADVWGLYGIQNDAGEEQDFIDVAAASADYNHQSVSSGSNNTSPANYTIAAFPAMEQSYNGYFLATFQQDGNGNSLQKDLDGDGLSYEHGLHFAFQAFPEEYGSTGNQAYIVNTKGTIWMRDGLDDCGGTCNRFNDSSSMDPAGTRGRGGVPPLIRFPAHPEDSGFMTK